MRAPKLNDPDLSLDDLMRLWPETGRVFVRHGMICVGCLIAPFHTVSDACAEYDLDPDAFLNELQAIVGTKTAR